MPNSLTIGTGVVGYWHIPMISRRPDAFLSLECWSFKSLVNTLALVVDV